MQSVQKDKVYKSPVRKLAHFFEKSRDQWKAKCRAAKRTVKCLTHRLRSLEKRQAVWKSHAQALQVEVAQLQAETAALEAEVKRLREGVSEGVSPLRALDTFTQLPRHHQYSVGHVKLFLDLVLVAAVSLHGASTVMAVVSQSFQLSLACPEWHTGRWWLLRLGYYKLTRPKTLAADWVWIIDHTVQIGPEKCLVILGVRLSALPPVGQCLGHADVEPIALLPVTHSNGPVVCQQLEKAVEKTGVPRAIVSDHGTDLQSGIEQFCAAHPETSPVYDIKHKTAAVLKHELGQDATWQAFTQLAAQTKRQVQQTPLASLAPPNLKTKARYMNAEGLIQWGQALLAFLDQPPSRSSASFDPAQVQIKLGWVTRFRQPLHEWADLLQVITAIESFVRHQGLYRDVHLLLKEQALPLAQTERARRVQQELLAFVAEQAAQAHPQERLVGSSEVIESVLGKMKRLEQDQAKSGFTGLILSVCALVSTTTEEIIQTALETVPTQKVRDWCKKNLGQSLQAKRKEALTPPKQAEQKWDRRLQPI